MTPTVFERVTVIGVGLIGGSFALGLKQAGLVKKVIGYARQKAHLDVAMARGLIDEASDDIAQAVSGADLVFISVPMDAFDGVLRAMQPHLSDNTFVTDAGSTKQSVVANVEAIFTSDQASRFVPGHPIAGKEQSGAAAACADLYQAHRVVLTPDQSTRSDALEAVITTWQALGAQVCEMPPHFHDNVFAATSHLPHFLAYALVDLLNEHEELGNVFQYTAGGFRDFTRIASSDPTMWRDIGKHNGPTIAKWLRHYRDEVDQLIEAIEQENWDGLYRRFDRAKQARDHHILGQSIQSPKE
ncbi:prephenate dehydrogenase/arogenate dehydrogenase family protein [Thiomicrospira sp. WB1]|uniref:prephenate dehydrogenase n=1 Tax=Thiomicrospira sp. WB1 TaxID=1685380 RepID=UPI0007494D2F|nr:prephenate dehydrogenase/arogenate dehydrogenase family protein [Thiomicrospira sp. WB1]KUJ72043.1 prephenate dehydrogenase [Thiomicrospira sp. WB1]